MRRLPPALMAALLGAGCGAQAADPEPPAAGGESVWNANVDHDASKRDRDDPAETMRVRIYNDERTHGDEHGGTRRPGIALDVDTEIVTCPDGHIRIDAINAGGKDFDIEGKCALQRDDNKAEVDRSDPPPGESE
ncbi:MAG: hypothetical protein ACE5G3_00050 [Gammaproteobacteria bacterium]